MSIRRKHLRRNEVKKRTKKIIISSLLILCLLSVGYGAFQTTISIRTTGHIVVDERCVVGNVFNFEQKDEIQEFKVPCSGMYKLETWGASGGDTLNYNGGYGGYSVGRLFLSIKQKLYVVIGNKGGSILKNIETDEIYQTDDNGYNGGNHASFGTCNSLSYRYGGGGGGATHVSLSKGLLNSLENRGDSILIVSGGGGGSFYYANNVYGDGGSGGGYIGNTAYFTLSGNHTKKYYATGGTQSVGGILGNSFSDYTKISGSFGYGGTYGNVACNNAAFGGSGYYGGGAGSFASGGGGSSYIGNPSLKDKAMYCYECLESLDLTKPEIFTVSTTGDSNYRDTLNCPNGYDENPVSKCAKKGDGYARITLIEKK